MGELGKTALCLGMLRNRRKF